MAATAAFLAAMAGPARSVATLLRVTVKTTAGGTQVVNLSTRALTTPDGTVWHGIITDPGVIMAPGDFLTSDVNLCSAAVECDAAAPVYAASTLGGLFTTGYVWVGSSVTMWLWEASLASWGDACRVFKGTVQTFDFDAGRVILSLRQRTDWNQLVVDDFVRREAYPNAPDDVVGAALPVAYGKIPALPARAPQFDEDYPFSNALERIRGGNRTAAGVLVEPGRGDAKAKVMFASHACASFADQAVGSGLFIETPDGKLAALKCPGDSFNTSALGAGVSIPDGSGVAYLSIWSTRHPADVDVGSGAEDLGVLFDPHNEQTFARVYGPLTDSDHSVLAVSFDAVGNVGKFVSARILVIYRTAGVTDMPLQVWRVGRPAADVQLGISGTNDWALWDADVSSSIIDWATQNVYFRTGYVPATGTGIVDVCAVGLELRYIPTQAKITSKRLVAVTKQRPTVKWNHLRPVIVSTPYTVYDTLPPEQEVRGKFFANLSGIRDDAIGTYTGAINAVVERPCDIAHHLLAVHGEQPEDLFDGSFAGARNSLKTWRGSDMVLGFGVSDSTDVMTSLAWVGCSSASWFHLSPHTDQWRCVVWGGPDTAPSYSIPLDRFVGLPRVSVRPDSSMVTNLRVAYGYDDHDGTYRHEVQIAPDRSCAGYKYHQQNDQSLEIVVGASDKIDLLDADSNTATVTLAAADHTFATLTADLSAKFAVAQPLGFTWSAGFGGVVTASCCDLDFSDGTTRTAAIATGFYAMEDMAAATQDALNSVGDGDWAVAYSRTTRKFTISKATGTAQLLFSAGANQATSPAAALGFYPENKTGALTYTSDFAIEEGLFALSSNGSIFSGYGEFSLRWRSGTNGHLAHNPSYTAHSVLGFVPYDDTPTVRYAVGVVPKGTLQQALRQTVQRYISDSAQGPARKPLTIEGRAIYDTDTALELRNRLAELTSLPRVVVSGLADGVIGLERGDVIECVLDDLCPYPDPDQNGSWVNKGLIVTEVVQHLGPDNCGTEFTAVAALES